MLAAVSGADTDTAVGYAAEAPATTEVRCMPLAPRTLMRLAQPLGVVDPWAILMPARPAASTQAPAKSPKPSRAVKRARLAESTSVHVSDAVRAFERAARRIDLLDMA